LYGLPRRKEKFRGEVAEAQLVLAYLRAEDLLSGMKLWSREERRLRDDWQDWPGDQVPVRIEVDRVDRLNVEDVLLVVRVANVKIRIVLKGNADQIGDRILRGLAQVFSLCARTTIVVARRIAVALVANPRTLGIATSSFRAVMNGRVRTSWSRLSPARI
jgi:hypothetical protein